MSHFPNVRRVVTAHDPATGKSIVDSDINLTPANPLDADGNPPPEGVIPGFTNVFKTTGGIPATNVQGEWFDVHGKKIGLVDQHGVVCRTVDCEFCSPAFTLFYLFPGDDHCLRVERWKDPSAYRNCFLLPLQLSADHDLTRLKSLPLATLPKT